MATSKRKAFRVLQFAKAESAITEQTAFLIKLGCQPPNDNYILRTATAGSDVVQSGRPIFDDFFQHLWPYIGNNIANVVFQMVKRLWLIRIEQRLYIAPQKII
ncbi:hypothetical protein TNCV_2705071 [Trichonephila clavipes]|nr:hypothetical protein TNCV_2705071 [Trichonephila clavipes]